MKVPRKLKKKIPRGVYCYTYKEPIYNKEGEWAGYKIEPCPLYTSKNIVEDGETYNVGWCKLVDCEIDDQCKMCGIKDDWKL